MTFIFSYRAPFVNSIMSDLDESVYTVQCAVGPGCSCIYLIGDFNRSSSDAKDNNKMKKKQALTNKEALTRRLQR